MYPGRLDRRGALFDPRKKRWTALYGSLIVDVAEFRKFASRREGRMQYRPGCTFRRTHGTPRIVVYATG